MAIGNLSAEEFKDKLNKCLSPSGPIQSFEYLRGRGDNLRQIERALNSQGRHVFIYGDRGVGKTSLAVTAANIHQHSSNDPIKLACEKDTTFVGIIKSLAKRINEKNDFNQISKKTSGGVNYKGLSLTVERQVISNKDNSIQINDINDAIDVVKRAEKLYSPKTLVIVDEFDLIESEEERIKIANFIKQLGDQSINIQFIFCGIAESLDDLLSGHKSAHRYIENIKLPRLGWDGRFGIIDASADAFGISIDGSKRFRIAAISDGFPYYIHLIMTNLYWELFEDENICSYVDKNHYVSAVSETTKGIQQYLRSAYDKATMRKSDDYHEILWASADHADFQRKSADIYDSYIRIKKIIGNDPISREKFNLRLNTLKGNSCENILVSKRRGWFEFRENIYRGYVRLRAEERGIELEISYTPGKIKYETQMHIKSKADTSIYSGRFKR